MSEFDTSHDMEQMAFETEAEDNRSRFDVTQSAAVAASNRTVENYSGADERFAYAPFVTLRYMPFPCNLSHQCYEYYVYHRYRGAVQERP